MDLLKSALLQVNPQFEDAAMEAGLASFEHHTCAAKEVIAQSGTVCDYLYFPVSSIIRCYYTDAKGEEQTLWMKPERSFVTEYKSFVHRQASQFSLQYYEATNCYRIHRNALMELYQKHNSWAMFGILLTEHVHITLIDVFVNLLSNDATRNYQYIAYAFPRFLQVAPLKDIASMLQISPVSLSRIRAGKQTKNGFS